MVRPNLEPADHLPFIGRAPGTRECSSYRAISGEGLTNRRRSILILPDLVEGKKNAWAKVYSRAASHRALTDSAVCEGYVGAAKTDREGYPSRAAEGIARGKGAIIKVKGKEHAAYRDRHGECTS